MAKTSRLECVPFPVLLLLLLVLHVFPATQNDLIINTRNGKIGGMVLSVPRGEVRAFLGIPYGKPPLGKQRFLPPEPAGSWNGVRRATKFPNSCYQLLDTFFPGFRGAEMWNPNTPLSEDCLYLNVWTPRFNHTHFHRLPSVPVFVWIYGGGFVTGTSSLELYDGRFLSQSEGVVVVSMNYRLGALGFLSLPENKNIRGNAGLLDQQLALRWVADNIAAFGGDASKVTLFGESAGAASVGFQLLSPGSRGLFHRAVMQSGSPNTPWATVSQEEAWERAMNLGKLLGCPLSPPDNLQSCLQGIKPEKIISKQYDVVTDPSVIQLPFVPNTDGIFLPKTPQELLQTGDFLKTEVLLGLNKDEGSYFLIYGMPGFNITGQSLISREHFLQGALLIEPGASDVFREAFIFQYTDWADENNRTKNRDMMSNLVGDQQFTCPMLEFAHRYSKHGGKTRLYLFDHRASTNPWPAWMGVMHGYEIEFVFGVPLNETQGYTPEEVTMSRKFMKHWANFARTGNPSIGGADWPMFTPDCKEYITLNSEPPERKKMMKAQQCHFWNNLMPKIQQVSDDFQSCVSANGVDPHCSNVLLLVLLVVTVIY
ncbi:acetylcholinesterase-like [Lampris incognitus]|uniref:acetylcholinesterase-like n=1 Tax=Lampris incognitus TaxID=2546036 RepID=UPI0024B4CFF5|nr:acetylcholinesterase-like [Lampris incognitus]